MKKKIIILFIITLGIFRLYGQSNFSTIGVVAGPSIFSVSGVSDFVQEYKPTISYSTGLSIESKLNERFGIASELLFESNNYQHIISSNLENDQIIDNWDYQAIVIPIHGLIYFGPGKKMFLGLGFYSRFLLEAMYSSVGPNNEYFELEDTANYKKINFGFSGSIGYIISITEKVSLIVNIENNLGVSDIYTNKYNISNSEHTPGINYNLKTNNFKLLFKLAYLIE